MEEGRAQSANGGTSAENGYTGLSSASCLAAGTTLQSYQAAVFMAPCPIADRQPVPAVVSGGDLRPIYGKGEDSEVA